MFKENKTKSDTSKEVEVLSDDIKGSAAWISASLSDDLDKIKHTLSNTKEKIEESVHPVIASTDKYVRDHSWMAIAFAAVVGLTIGILAKIKI